MPVQSTSEPLVHVIVGAQFGDLEFDVGKSVRWVTWFCDNVFVLDVNLGTPRYWIVNWAETFPNAKHTVTGINFFYSPDNAALFRAEQWKQYRKAFGEPDDNDWILFIDAHEGLSVDNRSLPDDYIFAPFKSFLWREIQRAQDASESFAVLPFYVFLRSDHITNVTYGTYSEVTGEWTIKGSADVDPVLQALSVPYYTAYQGLPRLWNVGALRSPDFDWSQIDTPVPWNHVPDVDAYLTPTVGIASTPDPGPLPNEFTFVYKVRRAEGLVQDTVCGQSPESGQRSWMLQTGHDVPLGAGYTWIWAASEDGDYYPYFVGEVAATATPWSPNDEVWAVSISIDDGSGQTSITSKFSGDGGATWTDVASDVGGKAVPFDSDGAVYIGEYGSGINPWQGRIYWVEARTGSDPQAGTLLWRFDASEHPGGGVTSYVDPRGREWTLTSADAITPFESGVGRPVAKAQILSYGYAHWNLQDIEPPATTVPPLTEENDDGWRMRKLLSQVRPIPGLPVGDTWVSPSSDPPGLPGPWAPADANNPDALNPNTLVWDPVLGLWKGTVLSQPVSPDPSLEGLVTPLYDCVFRLNMRDGVWYEANTSGNIPLRWDEVNQMWVTDYDPALWADKGVKAYDSTYAAPVPPVLVGMPYGVAPYGSDPYGGVSS